MSHLARGHCSYRLLVINQLGARLYYSPHPALIIFFVYASRLYASIYVQSNRTVQQVVFDSIQEVAKKRHLADNPGIGMMRVSKGLIFWLQANDRAVLKLLRYDN